MGRRAPSPPPSARASHQRPGSNQHQRRGLPPGLTFCRYSLDALDALECWDGPPDGPLFRGTWVAAGILVAGSTPAASTKPRRSEVGPDEAKTGLQSPHPSQLQQLARGSGNAGRTEHTQREARPGPARNTTGAQRKMPATGHDARVPTLPDVWPPDLRTVVNAWEGLPEPLKACVSFHGLA